MAVPFFFHPKKFPAQPGEKIPYAGQRAASLPNTKWKEIGYEDYIPEQVKFWSIWECAEHQGQCAGERVWEQYGAVAAPPLARFGQVCDLPLHACRLIAKAPTCPPANAGESPCIVLFLSAQPSIPTALQAMSRTSSSPPAAQVTLVDGGFLSNHPVDLFHVPREKVVWCPTFCVNLSPPRTARRTGNLIETTAALLSTGIQTRDFEFVAKNKVGPWGRRGG